MMFARSLIAETYLSWLPAFSLQGFLCILLLCGLLWATLRVFWGPSLVHPRIGLWGLRACTLATVAAILFGPTIVDERAGEVFRHTMMYLFDGSQSMQLGGDETRWQEGLRFVSEAEQGWNAARWQLSGISIWPPFAAAGRSNLGVRPGMDRSSG